MTLPVLNFDLHRHDSRPRVLSCVASVVTLLCVQNEKQVTIHLSHLGWDTCVRRATPFLPLTRNDVTLHCFYRRPIKAQNKIRTKTSTI